MKAKGIFIDLDGTIVDSSPAYIEAANVAFSAFGRQPPERRVALEIPRRLEKRQPLDDLLGIERKKFLDVYLKTYYSLTLAKTSLMPQAHSTLLELSSKAKLALITMRSMPKESIILELSRFDIAKYFSYVVTAQDAKPKPSPDGLIVGGKILNIPMDDCIIAGDSVNDIRAGKAAGIKTVAVLSGLFYPEELMKEEPDLILPTLSELPKYIE